MMLLGECVLEGFKNEGAVSARAGRAMGGNHAPVRGIAGGDRALHEAK
jgi:hypothetical protein